MLQRSSEWFEARKGRFTASEITRLLGKKGLKRTNQSIDNFAFEKALEIVHGLDEDEDEINSIDIERGVNNEPLAFRLFKQEKELLFLETKEVGFYPFEEFGGASPDGLVSDNSCLEIKCPRRKKFFRIVANGIGEIDSKYIDQMQMQMLCTGTDKTYFVNYHIEKGEELMHEIIILRDEERIGLIKERIIEASKIVKNYIELLKQ